MSIRASFSHKTGNFLCCGYGGTISRSRENANDLEPNPRDHPAQNDRRRPVHARGAQRKAQADPCAEGVVGEPVAVSKSVAFCIIGAEFFSVEKFPASLKRSSCSGTWSTGERRIY